MSLAPVHLPGQLPGQYRRQTEGKKNLAHRFLLASLPLLPN